MSILKRLWKNSWKQSNGEEGNDATKKKTKLPLKMRLKLSAYKKSTPDEGEVPQDDGDMHHGSKGREKKPEEKEHELKQALGQPEEKEHGLKQALGQPTAKQVKKQSKNKVMEEMVNEGEEIVKEGEKMVKEEDTQTSSSHVVEAAPCMEEQNMTKRMDQKRKKSINVCGDTFPLGRREQE